MKIQNIKKKETYLKKSLIGILALAIYFILPNFEGIIFYLLNIDTQTVSTEIKIIYSLIFNILMMALIILLFNKSLQKDIQDIKINHKQYYTSCFRYWVIGLIVMMFSNLVISIISGGNMAGNQESINSLFAINPFYVYFAAVIYAPVVEELVFRKAIYTIIPNKYLFIITSGLIFGGLHVIGNIEAWYDLLYLIPYSAPGIMFAYMLNKTNNILVSMGFHFMHNGILIAFQFFALLFG